MLADQVEVQTVKLVRLVPDGGGSVTAGGSQGASRAVLLRRRLPFLLMVVLPTLLAAVYFFALAAPRYESEVKFVVRTPNAVGSGELASILQGSSVIRANDEAFIAKDYMLSRDAMQHLITHDNLMGMFAKAGVDVLWRYPLVWFVTPNAESTFKHYLNFVSVEYDSSSGVSTLTAQGFEPDDPRRIADSLVSFTETFLNGLNTRAQDDAVRSAMGDVEAAKKRAYDTLDAMTVFRNRQTVLDPTVASKGIVESISALSLDNASTNTRLADLLTNTPQSPEIPTLRSKLAALQTEITNQRQQLGGRADSLAPQIADYQRLMLDQQFAEKAFTSALASLESARLDASRQRVFLERVTTPDVPDAPAYPHRVIGVLVTFGICIGLWRIIRAFVLDTQEHNKR